MTIRFGLIGFGLFGRHHARSLSSLVSAPVSAICAATPASREAAAELYPQARIYADWRELVASPDIDAVDIVSPNHMHAEMAIAALEAGKKVIVEKPLATTVADCERVIETLERTGGVLSVGHELRVSRQWGRIRKLIEDGMIGTPCYANLSLFRFPFRQGSAGWRYDPQRVGSWILEEPIHFYDLILWYFDPRRPVRVQAHGVVPGPTGMYENFTSTVTFEDGAVAVVSQSLAGFGHYVVLDLTGDQGALRSFWSGADARSPTPSFDLAFQRQDMHSPQVVPIERSGELFELAEQLRQTVLAFEEGGTVIDATEATRAVRVCLAAERSLREGRPIDLE